MDDSVNTDSAIVMSSDETVTERLRTLEHFAELGRLSASLLHEISNPLTAAMLYLEQYDNQQSPHIRQARRNIRLLQRYVEAARQQVRQESMLVSFGVQLQIDQVRRLLTPLARSRGVRLCFEAAASCKLFGDPVKFQHIVANLIINAIDAYNDNPLASNTSHSKCVTIRLNAQQHWLILCVIDHGSGLSSAEMPRIFEPFYTTKSQDDQGLGLGLALVRQYVEQDFGGAVSLVSSPRHGTEFTVKLRLPQPLQRSQTSTTMRRQPTLDLQTATGVVSVEE